MDEAMDGGFLGGELNLPVQGFENKRLSAIYEMEEWGGIW
jgi:hypothetical protein